MTDDATLPRQLDDGLNKELGFVLTELSEEGVAGHFEVVPEVLQPFGIVHGGTYSALAETLASIATFMAVKDGGEIAVGQNNNTSFLRPVSNGTVTGSGRVRHRGRTSWVWDVDMTDAEGRLCATSRVTMAVRPAPS